MRVVDDVFGIENDAFPAKAVVVEFFNEVPGNRGQNHSFPVGNLGVLVYFRDVDALSTGLDVQSVCLPELPFADHLLENWKCLFLSLREQLVPRSDVVPQLSCQELFAALHQLLSNPFFVFLVHWRDVQVVHEEHGAVASEIQFEVSSAESQRQRAFRENELWFGKPNRLDHQLLGLVAGSLRY